MLDAYALRGLAVKAVSKLGDCPCLALRSKVKEFFSRLAQSFAIVLGNCTLQSRVKHARLGGVFVAWFEGHVYTR